MAKPRKGGALKSVPTKRARPAAKRSKPVPRTKVPIPEISIPIDVERPLSPDELSMERDRIYARMVSIPNVISRPSPADFVAFEVADPTLVHRRLVAAGIPSDTIQKYPKIPNGLRVIVRSAKRNEAFLRALEVAVK